LFLFFSFANSDEKVYFLYPETSGVRLEDMDVLFGDATTAMPTPATEGERGSLLGAGAGSPVPSLDIRRPYGQFGAESAIPGLDIDPPSFDGPGSGSGSGLNNNKAGSSPGLGRGEGFGGWISKMVKRSRGGSSASQSQYRQLGQGEEGDDR
jgi:hypothetical protein